MIGPLTLLQVHFCCAGIPAYQLFSRVGKAFTPLHNRSLLLHWWKVNCRLAGQPVRIYTGFSLGR